ncbi:MAG: glutamyl-tRNA reductase [Planctomycetota bacterium]|nr:glutamyl-tRNA reductase [Planctomycetota bacterium]
MSRTPPEIFMTGLSHKTAPVALRERLAFRADALPLALGHLTGPSGFHEAVILSTCNRVEIYAVGGPEAGAAAARTFLAEFHRLPEGEFAKALYEQRGGEAVRHLFEVAASLDSLIVGETEILGQAREAYRLAAEAGAAGPVLRQVFERAFFLAKELRGEGGLSGVQASVSSAAVELAGKIFEDLRGAKVLVLGTGEMAAGIARALRAAGVEDLLVSSRTLERAEAFAQAEGGRCAPIEQLPEHLAASDIVLVSTAAPHYIIGAGQVERAQAARHGRPLFMIDISVPRNVDPEVNRRTDTFLYDIDDLEAVAGEGRAERERIAERWRPRLADEARSVLNELAEPLPDETARLLLARVSELREAEVAALRASGAVDREAFERVERAFDRFQSKLLHGALATLKEAARDGDGAAAAQWVARIFGLHAPQAGKKEPGDARTSGGRPSLAERPMPSPAPFNSKES